MLRHTENECQKNLEQPAVIEKQLKHPSVKNGILRLDTANVNDYLSGSESNETEQPKTPKTILSRTRTHNKSKK